MFLRLKYLKFLGLEQYSESNNGINFRCPICGDSKTSKTKKSAYILGVESDSCRFYCFRASCGANYHFNYFLKLVNYSLYLNYLEERRKYDVNNFNRKQEPKSIEITSIKEKQSYNDVFSKYLYTIDECRKDNEVRQYLDKRKIPSKHFNKIYYFNGNIYDLFGKLFDSDKWEEKAKKSYIKAKGVVVPFINRYNENIGLGFRMLNHRSRFINLFNDYKDQFFFGENKCDFDRPIYVVEGMLDKLTFSDDSQILCMISANSRLNYLKKLTDKKATYIYDYEYMNKGILRRCQETINEGHNLFLWNSDIYKGKDINDLKMLYDKNDKEILDIIEKNTYNGLAASMMLTKRYNELTETLLWR